MPAAARKATIIIIMLIWSWVRFILAERNWPLSSFVPILSSYHWGCQSFLPITRRYPPKPHPVGGASLQVRGGAYPFLR